MATFSKIWQKNTNELRQMAMKTNEKKFPEIMECVFYSFGKWDTWCNKKCLRRMTSFLFSWECIGIQYSLKDVLCTEVHAYKTLSLWGVTQGNPTEPPLTCIVKSALCWMQCVITPLESHFMSPQATPPPSSVNKWTEESNGPVYPWWTFHSLCLNVECSAYGKLSHIQTH